MTQDPDEFLSDWARRAEQASTLTTDISQRMQQVTATAEAKGGEAVVTVDHTGGMANLRISDGAMRLPAPDLARIILATSRRAQAKMAQQMVDMVKDVYGPDSGTVSFVADAYSERFPEPMDDEERGRR